MRFSALVLSGCALAALSASASAATITPGTYTLHNHPDGNARPPLYGARFDELVNATGGHDIFTLDFDAPTSFVTLTYTGTTIRIQGVAAGGRDNGGSYAADAFLGQYTIDFLYNVGVQSAVGDDDVQVVAASESNFGFVTLPGGSTVNLTDMFMGGYSFRLGDENNDAGHRGHNGISGWGWMSYVNPNGGAAHIDSTDWLFTATRTIPTPGTAALALAALSLGARRRR